jgi:6-pyruvoyltetrahydropterin/6-carboxytetrahydropterin synthase
MSRITATRYHDFSAGHRVCGHESKCAHLHGHNYRVHFTVAKSGEGLDGLGRVLDFSAIKQRLCEWLEQNWDHRTLIWEQDPWLPSLRAGGITGVVDVPFNPTAENIAEFLLKVVGPIQLLNTGVILIAVNIEETRKCSATAEL